MRLSIALASVFFTGAGAVLYAQHIDRSDISVFGRNHFGRILQVSDERLNDWYMAYDVAGVGAYPYLKTGFDKDIQCNYQKAGLRYYFPMQYA